MTKDMMRLLNLNYLKLTNRTFSSGSADMPRIDCNIAVLPDFIALYSEPGLYRKTKKTAVAFYEYDSVFDGKNGLYQAIYCGDAKRLKYFKKRFENVKYAIVPDYSLLGDVHEAENVYRMFKARIAGLWFMFEIGAAVIPNITLCGPKSAQYALAGYEHCSVAAVNAKGHVRKPEEYRRLKENVRTAAQTLPRLQTLIVYDACADSGKIARDLSEAAERNLEIVIPENTLKTRNKILRKQKQDSRRQEQDSKQNAQQDKPSQTAQTQTVQVKTEQVQQDSLPGLSPDPFLNPVSFKQNQVFGKEEK